MKNKNMKTRRINLMSFTCLFLVGLVFTSCELTTLDQPEEQPEEAEIFEPNVIPQTAAEFRVSLHGETSRVWTNTSFTLAGLDGLQDCRLDDTFEINADGTYVYDGGETLCRAEDNERVRTGTWEIINDGANIVFDKDTEREYTGVVNGLENNTLSISGQYLGLDIKGIYEVMKP